MRIGYPCINRSIDCKNNKTFRLMNYSHKRLIETVNNNLECLKKILSYNLENRFFFFRITSDLIPFASHKVMDFDWKDYFKKNFQEIGKYIKENNIRISMHPGQYTVLNSINEQVFQRSLKEIDYHINLLDLMELDKTAKVQVHLGGVYGDKRASKRRFIKRYAQFDEKIKKRLILENDDKSYNLKDCIAIHQNTLIPIAFDVYHNEVNPSNISLHEAFIMVMKTWQNGHGLPIIHYSTEHPSKGFPSHAEKINIQHFKKFIENTKAFDFDIMLEIKDKEASALKALNVLEDDPRFIKD
jgi:UV DNA damage endonuclease